MCGIFGHFSFVQSLSLQNSISRLNLITHRGPDGFGFEYGNYRKNEYSLKHNEELDAEYFEKHNDIDYFFGHRRLSIVDLHENASQPMESADNRYSIIFNGEIYNYIELKKELLAKNCVFKTDHSDTEVLLNAYSLWGESCLSKLRGMFAFAIYDREKKEIFMARDRIGQKTIYYEINDNKFVFSSEIPAMVRGEGGSYKINLTALSYYTLLGYVPYPLSIFEGVFKLPPASFAKIDLLRKNISIDEYWDIDFDKNPDGTSDEFQKKIEKYLSDSVELRLRADVPVGAFISGGIDSTLVVKKIKEIGQKEFDIFGADFPQPEKSEGRYINQVALRYGQRLNISNIDNDHVGNIKNTVAVFDEPFDGGSSVALYDLFKHASKRYKVILTGDGGDEMFAGYERYQTFPKKFTFFKKLDALLLPKKILKLMTWIGLSSRKLKKLDKVINKDIVGCYLNYNRNFELLKILKHKVDVSVKKLTVFDKIKSKVIEKKLSPVKSLQYLELKTILPGRMLYKLDRFSMSFGVEARSPFLDHYLVDMAFSIPEEFNINKKNTKILPKKILEQDFPIDFVHRKKQGFGNPFSSWFSCSNTNNIFDILTDRTSLIFKYLNYEQLHKEFPQFINGYTGDREKEMWRFLVLAYYLENYSDVIEY